ncbi:GTP-binding protein HflX [Sulfuriferula multivorans]|uniref:GTPase HflX n=1 Tax=Sulfuriferula multivorans TaxID=1559896 RepID=A0A401JYV9_9PROT|nr:GTPase HflX [Sulfuriferula multivorans]GCB02173.1 GTP-binding protein HflX [Sulfuriferula multivorans]
MFERHAGSERVVLASLDFGEPDYADSVEELHRLAESAQLEVAGLVEGRRVRPDAALFAGSGKVEEIAAMVQSTEAGVVIFNHALSPAQERNLEKILQCRVVDRTSLILDIFARRAQSAEGQLQIELAQLGHISTRLVRGWTHLERQKGGVGLRGPGETQLETDRRLIGKRVKLLKDRLVKQHRQRTVQRRARSRGRVMSVSLVGYTNTGKSTLFNTLTNAGSYAADQLFATLDTTTRQLYLPNAGEIVVSDTVGFITRLPHTLVESFRATLEETIQADLLLHVVDACNPNRDKQIAEVNKVLAEIGALHVPQILVMNKIDLGTIEPGVEQDEYGKITRIRVSAKTGAGIPALRDVLTQMSQHHHEPAAPQLSTAIINNEYHPELD